MISVILTTHEGYAKYLDAAIQSVYDQTHKDWELIVVVDGPEKDCPDTVKVLKEKWDGTKGLNVIWMPENFGQHTRPKNVGTMAAQGDFIAYLDADNTYRKDHLQALWKALENMEFGPDAVYGDRMINYLGTDRKSMPGVKSEFRLGLLAQQNYIDTSDVLAKKSAIESVGGWDESLPYFADWNLWVRMAKNGSFFVHVPLILTDYNVHDSNNLIVQAPKEASFDAQTCLLWPEQTSYGEAPPLRVAIYTMTYDRLEYTMETFQSMRDNTQYAFDHFVLDQNSTDNTWTWLCDKEKEMNLKLFTENKNLGISAGSNYLVDKIKEVGNYDIIIKVDNDARFITPGWLERIIDCNRRSRLAIFSPYVEGLIDHPGGSPRIRDGWIGGEYIGFVQHLGGICVAAPAKCYENFRWETEDFLHGEQDWIFSQEMTRRGFQLYYLENVKIEHIDSTTGQMDKFPEYFQRRKVEKVTRYTLET
jgi:glycosyltransferase involved in cell wall biosynthesis